MRRLAYAALVANGVLIGHAVAYLGAESPEASATHGYLGPLGAALFPVGVAAVVLLVRDAAASSRWRVMLAVGVSQALVFLAQESTEHFLAGESVTGALDHPTLWWGLGAQLLVAAGSLALISLLRRVGGSISRVSGGAYRLTLEVSRAFGPALYRLSRVLGPALEDPRAPPAPA